MMKLLQSPVTWVVVILLGAIGVVVALKLGRRSNPIRQDDVNDAQSRPGFMEVVKHPQEWQQDSANEERAHEHALEAARKWNDEQVSKAVRHFVLDASSSRDAWSEFQVLRSLGFRIDAALLELLRDPSLRERLIKPTGKDLLPEAPLNRICKLFDENPPKEVVSLLVPFLNDRSAEIRKSVALTLGTIGNDSIVDPLRKALADSDEYVRSYALMGLEYADKHHRLSAACCRNLFGDVRRLLKAGNNGAEASRVLLYLDQQSATEFFLSSDMFNPDARSLHYILETMRERGIVVPRDRLLSLIEKLSGDVLKYPHTYQLGEALRALGIHKVPEDRISLEKYLSHRESIVAEGAAVGMLASHGLNGFQERLWKVVEEHGQATLTTPQRRYHAVINFDGEVNNGGLTQYFFNSTGDEWRIALDGLEAMGSKERLKILREAIARFGPSGPSESHGTRSTQLSKIVRAKEKVFEELDSRYYKSTEVVSVMAMRFVLKNPEAFR